MIALHEGDCLDLLRNLSDQSVDAVVTDPYFERNALSHSESVECVRAWLQRTPHKSLMQGPEVWREVLRILKPGGHLLVFVGTQAMDLVSMAVRLGGFELRDYIGWVAECESSLKPGWEPILMARRPLEGTVGENVLRHGTGGINIDKCRIESGLRPQVTRYKDPAMDLTRKVYGGGLGGTRWDGTLTSDGRWPANVIHDGSNDVEETFALYGESKDGFSGRSVTPSKIGPTGLKARENAWGGYGGGGTAARFFFCAPSSDRGRPLSLMRYLVQLVTPPDGVVLDPFSSNGLTGQAARDVGISAILFKATYP